MSAPTLPELIARIRESGGSLTIELALTEIDRRLTALEERTAPPLSGNQVTANLLRAAKEARAKAVEDGLAVLEGRTTITCTCRKFTDGDGTVRGFLPVDGCAMHGNRPEDVAAREAFAEAWKAHNQGAESEPVAAGQRAAALVMLGPELREEARKQRAAMQEATDAGRVDVISSSFSAAHVGQVPLQARIDALRAALSGMVADESAGKTVLRMLAAEALAADDKAARASQPASTTGDEVPGLTLGTFRGQPVKARLL